MDEGQAPVLSELHAALIEGTTTLELRGVRNDTATLYAAGGNFTDVRIHWKSSYQPTFRYPTPQTPPFSYIHSFGVGIISASVSARVDCKLTQAFDRMKSQAQA